MMNLKILLPTAILIDRWVTKIIAEAENGYFCLLPKHLDFVAALVPGILTFTDTADTDHFVGTGAAVLTKEGPEVRVASMYATTGLELGAVREGVARRLDAWDQRERLARSATAKLEADFLRRIVTLGAEVHD